MEKAVAVDGKPMLTMLAMAFVLVALIIIFMQIAQVGYYRAEKMKSENVDRALAAVALAETELSAAEVAHAAAPQDEAASARLVAARKSLDDAKVALHVAKRDYNKGQGRGVQMRDRLHDCRASVKTKGLGRFRDVANCMREKPAAERLTGLGPAESALLGQSGFKL
jgi:hypothetical protein